MSDEPIWVASRMRWLSPPERVPAERASVRYSRPTLRRNPSRSRISLTIELGDHLLARGELEMVEKVKRASRPTAGRTR